MQLATLTNRRPSERLELLRLRDTHEVLMLWTIFTPLNQLVLEREHLDEIHALLSYIYVVNESWSSCITWGVVICCRRGLGDLFFLWRRKNKDVDCNEGKFDTAQPCIIWQFNCWYSFYSQAYSYYLLILIAVDLMYLQIVGVRRGERERERYREEA